MPTLLNASVRLTIVPRDPLDPAIAEFGPLQVLFRLVPEGQLGEESAAAPLSPTRRPSNHVGGGTWVVSCLNLESLSYVFAENDIDGDGALEEFE